MVTDLGVCGQCVFTLSMSVPSPGDCNRRASAKAKKKTDVVEHLKVFHHVGILTDKFPGAAGSLFI